MEKPIHTAENIFSQALELPAGQARREFISRQCANAPELQAEVESLLQAHAEGGAFLEPSAGLETKLDLELAAADRKSASHLPQIPGYVIEHRIGEGSLGIVYRAHDQKLKRNVAIKVLKPQPNQSLRRRVVDEARRTAALTDPAVVTIYSVLEETDPPAIVMELVDGYPIDKFSAQLSFDQKARLLREVARGLGAAHERGLVHRDLKPENIVVGPDMRPRILDFGLALSFHEAGTSPGGFEGTPLYASPEQVHGTPLQASSDIFSFGSLMFKVLTGQPPFSGRNVRGVFDAITTTRPPIVRDVAVGVPEDLQAICLACLAQDPKDRPSAQEIALDLGRFLVGEPVRVRPKLYNDLLRQNISEYSNQARAWESQRIISGEERDALEVVHRRLLADEDHWIIEARRITLPQTILSGGTWLAVVATVLMVWLLRNDLSAPWRWLLPTSFTLILIGAGHLSQRLREELAAATFLAGAALSVAPSTLSLLGESGLLARPVPGVRQLFSEPFTNQQVLVASLIAFVISGFSLWRLKMTGFAWTTATLAVSSYLSILLQWNWLDQKPEIQALWCLPLLALEPAALRLERLGRVRWTLPFHLVALITLAGCLDVIAWNAPTLQWLGISPGTFGYFDEERLRALSFAINGMLFLGLMLITERARSLDLRRSSKLLEILAILHTLSALFANALGHRQDSQVRVDVWLYLGAAALFVALAPFRSRWRILVGGLAGCGLGSYLLVDLGIVAKQPFVIALGLSGLTVALGTFAALRLMQHFRWQVRSPVSKASPPPSQGRPPD